MAKFVSKSMWLSGVAGSESLITAAVNTMALSFTTMTFNAMNARLDLAVWLVWFQLTNFCHFKNL